MSDGYGWAKASIGSTPANLLSTSTSSNTWHGVGYYFDTLPQVDASASWSGDRVLIGSPTGQALPQSIRLNFSVDYPVAYLGPYSDHLADISVNFDGQRGGLSVGPGFPVSSLDGAPFDSSSIIKSVGWAGIEHATFHLDLPVNAGLSDPFQVGIENVAATSREISGVLLGGQLDATLSVVSVTLPDGNTPESEGYTVAFASGLASPNAAPEPATLVVLGVGLGAFAAVRRRVIARRRPDDRI